MKKIKILIPYVEAGMGHIVTSQAISESLKKLNNENLEIICCKAFQDSKDPDLIKYEKGIVEQVKMANKLAGYGNFQFAMMQLFGPQTSLKFVHSTVFAKIKKKTMEYFASFKPDVIISTHYVTTHFAIELKNRFLPKLSVITYDPDPNVHGWWDTRTDLFITNNEQATIEAIQTRGFTPSQIRQVFFVTRNSVINCNLTKDEAREKLNIPVNKFTVILADGAYASSKLKEYTNELLKTDLPITILVIAGKNQKVYEYFTKKIGKNKIPNNITLRVYGFVNNIAEMYKASDIFITKAGPNAILDSLFMHTPIMVNFYASPVEKATCKLFVNHFKCGVKCLNKVKAREMIEGWINDKTRKELQTYSHNSLYFDKTKNGADEIAKIVLNYILEENNEKN